jgi:succinoglycan biosynthesis transport protein ExoP
MQDDVQDREEWMRERSLLALGRTLGGGSDIPKAGGSLLAMAAAEGVEPSGIDDAAARHRAAREGREACSDRTGELTGAAPDFAHDLSAHGDIGAGSVPGNASRAATGRARHMSWRLVACTTALGALLGISVGLWLPARYQATAELAFNSEATDGGSAFESQLRVLTSGMVLTRVVDRLNLLEDPEFNGRDGVGGSNGLLRAMLGSHHAGDDAGHRKAFAIDRLAASLSVSRKGTSNGIAVTATTGNGEKSALIANAVTDVFVQIYEQGKRDEAAQLPHGKASVRSVSSATGPSAGRSGERDLDQLARNPARLAEILQLDEELAAARARTEALKAKVEALRAADVESLAGGLPGEFETKALQALRVQYLDIKRQYDKAAVELGPRNPERRAVEAQLKGARERLSAELRRIVNDRQGELQQAIEAEQALATRMAETGLSGEEITRLRQSQETAAAFELPRAQGNPFPAQIMEATMYPAYPDQALPAPQQHPWQGQFGTPAPMPYPVHASTPPAMAYPPPPYPHQPTPYPAGWQPAPAPPAYPPYAHPATPHAAHFYPPQPSFAQPLAPLEYQQKAPDYDALEEIRASLREFREALRDLAESRSRRRFP